MILRLLDLLTKNTRGEGRRNDPREETLCVFELYSSPSIRLFRDWGLGMAEGELSCLSKKRLLEIMALKVDLSPDT